MQIPRLRSSVLAALLLLLFFTAASPLPQTDPAPASFGILRDHVWSADGSRFLTVTGSGAQVYAWDEVSLALQAEIISTRHPRSGALNADGTQVFLGTEEGVIELWDGLSGEPLSEWEAHRLPILDLAVSADDALLLSVGWRSDAAVWHSADGTLISTLPAGSIGAAVGNFAPDGTAVLWSREFKLQFFDPRSGALLVNRTTPVFPKNPVFSPDGSFLAGVFNGQAQVIDAASGKLQQALDAEFPIESISLSDDGSMAAVLGGGQYLLFDLADGTLLEHWQAQAPNLYHAAAFSPPGSHLFLLGSAIHSRDVRQLGFFSRFHLTGRADAYTLSPEGDFLASRVNAIDYVEIWRTGTARPVQTLTGFAVPVMDAAFLPDGRLAVSADSLTVWDAAAGEILEEWKVPLPQGTADFTVWVYDPDARQSRPVTLDHLPLGTLGISADGRWIAAEGMDGSLYVWDFLSAQPQPISYPLGLTAAARNMQSQVREILFSADHTQVIAWLQDDSLHAFDLATRAQTVSFTLPAGAPAYEETCLRQWDAARQVLVLADGSSTYEIDATDGSVTQATGGICGFNGADYTVTNGKIPLQDGVLSISPGTADKMPRRYNPRDGLLVYQDGRFSDFHVLVRRADSTGRQTDLFKALTDDRYRVAALRAAWYDPAADMLAVADARGLLYRGGTPESDFGFPPAAAVFSSEDGEVLLSGFDGSVILHSESGTEELLAGKTRPAVFRALAFDPTGRRKAAGNDAGTVLLWDAANAMLALETPGGAVQALLFTPDASHLAVRGADGISFWQLRESAPPQRLETMLQGSVMAFSPQGTLLAVSTREGYTTALRLYRFPSLEPVAQYAVDARLIAFRTETDFLALSARLWTCTLGENCRTMDIPETFTIDAASLTAATDRIILVTVDGQVRETVLNQEP
ncbi:MAG: WD40 repeat domain-containing protein [Anaerolineae bacterium]|nr:WD40 repeat domain-containing protein [Anaerolineae bacterium]